MLTCAFGSCIHLLYAIRGLGYIDSTGDEVFLSRKKSNRLRFDSLSAACVSTFCDSGTPHPRCCRCSPSHELRKAGECRIQMRNSSYIRTICGQYLRPIHPKALLSLQCGHILSPSAPILR
ncbi:hypothetical protein PR003_g23680 [Phytophthora rubi]|uniref:Uncharacterized protein n=1 Tax=Phytophthora rubi TaxID=129364 RepID=A0A6A3J6B9_9STRA|nr:hypothetical protein PR002_g22837 [Phytophthora rubi]KAE8987865.1 hypothetical protein PR001_g22199 [Phytophthora rubi]KAE9296737.1 hypothetical protein PR003_g23680 [Phytophthora rubi]